MNFPTITEFLGLGQTGEEFPNEILALEFKISSILSKNRIEPCIIYKEEHLYDEWFRKLVFDKLKRNYRCNLEFEQYWFIKFDDGYSYGNMKQIKLSIIQECQETFSFFKDNNKITDNRRGVVIKTTNFEEFVNIFDSLKFKVNSNSK